MLGGDGEISRVKKIVNEKKLKKYIKVLGWIDKDKKEKYLRECSIFILPSYNEGMPMSIIEAMAYKNAVISTNVGGIPQVIDNNKNGILIEPGDKKQLYNSIEKLIKDKKFKEKIKIGYVPQSLNIERNIPTTVYDMFASYISNSPVCFKKDKKVYNLVLTNLKKFGAGDLIEKKVGNLSGGELQRVLLAIATTPIPNLLILDEPVSGIDINGIKEFYEMLTELKNKYDMSIVLVSHDLNLVKKFADKVILLDKRVIKQGTVEEVFNSEEFKKRFGEI